MFGFAYELFMFFEGKCYTKYIQEENIHPNTWVDNQAAEKSPGLQVELWWSLAVYSTALAGGGGSSVYSTSVHFTSVYSTTLAGEGGSSVYSTSAYSTALAA